MTGTESRDKIKEGVFQIVKKLIKSTLFSVPVIFVLLLLGLKGSDIKKCHDIRSYYISVELSKEHRVEVRRAIRHVETKVKCVCFKEVEIEDVKRVNALMFFRMDRNGYDAETKITTLGYFDRTKNIIVLSDRSALGKKPWLLPPTLFKVATHEVAHWLGMPRGHAFAEELSSESLLTPIISSKSEPHLYKRDIEYLNNMTCSESQVIYDKRKHR